MGIVFNEPSIVISKAQEPMQEFGVRQSRPLLHCNDFLWISVDAVFGYDMPKIADGYPEKRTFSELDVKNMFVQCLEDEL